MVKKIALRGWLWKEGEAIRISFTGHEQSANLRTLLADQAPTTKAILHARQLMCSACHHRYTPRKAHAKRGCPKCGAGRTA